MNIDPKDLRPVTAKEIPLGGTFYRKELDGTFSRCVFYKEDFTDPTQAAIIKYHTEEYSKAGRLFVNRNNPFKSFVK